MVKGPVIRAKSLISREDLEKFEDEARDSVALTEQIAHLRPVLADANVLHSGRPLAPPSVLSASHHEPTHWASPKFATPHRSLLN